MYRCGSDVSTAKLSTGFATQGGSAGGLEGALVATTPGGTVFSPDPAHPERKPHSG